MLSVLLTLIRTRRCWVSISEPELCYTVNPHCFLCSTEMLHLFYDRQGVRLEVLLHPPPAAGIVKRPLGSSKENFATHSSRDSR